ncbi:hypothetical protein SCHPADRAFT_886683 [Schizopora paradoxa]|uniref:F-box domain-containing protein n=1 Tax=Schizopora paradoxa TaxID=27342 RepID=A0A0H2S1J2_9AGAM|nr:hypothetical protein SCHPADRAFT_886683 [Schizopora paradoxa]
MNANVLTGMQQRKDTAHNVEELSVIVGRNDFAGSCSRQVEELFGDGTDFNNRWTLPNCSSLRVVRFTNFSLENFGGNHGLPFDFSCLLRFENLEAVHFYRSMFPREAQIKDFRQFIRKSSWTRKVGEAFALDSVYVDVVRSNLRIPGREHSARITQLIKRAPNLTLEVSNDYASNVAPIILLAWSSLQSLTIIADDFPNPDLLRHAPTSIDMLVIAFQGCRCRYEPLFLDRRILGFLRPRTTRNVRICISSSKDESIFGRSFLGLTHDTHSLFFTPSNELFGETRALCARRGGKFM